MKSAAPPPSHLRNEIFLLGNRYQGDPLRGARLELEAPGLSPQRRKLLNAVVRYLDPHPSHHRTAPVAQPNGLLAGRLGRSSVVSLLLYGGVALILLTWAASVLLRGL